MKRHAGFTLIELLATIILLFAAGTIFYFQKNDLDISHQDSQRKTSINALYYHLEDIFYITNQYYPEELTADTTKGLDPELLKDPAGVTIGQAGSSLRYEPTNCSDGKCRSYTLRADLTKEADFIKTSVRQ